MYSTPTLNVPLATSPRPSEQWAYDPVDRILQGIGRLETRFTGPEQLRRTYSVPMSVRVSAASGQVSIQSNDTMSTTRPDPGISQTQRSFNHVTGVANWARDVAARTQDPRICRTGRSRDHEVSITSPRFRRYTRHAGLHIVPADGYVPSPIRNATTASPSVTAASLSHSGAMREREPMDIQRVVKNLCDMVNLERRFTQIQGHRTPSSKRAARLCALLNDLDAYPSHASQVVRSVRRRLVRRVHVALGKSSPVSLPVVTEGLSTILDLERRFERVANVPLQARRAQLGDILRALDAIPSDTEDDLLRQRRRLVRRVLRAIDSRRVAPEINTLAVAKTLNTLAGIERTLKYLIEKTQPMPVETFLDALRAEVVKLAPIRTAGVSDVKRARAQVKRLIGEAFRRAQTVPFARAGTPTSPRSPRHRPRSRSSSHNAPFPSGTTWTYQPGPARSTLATPSSAARHIQPLLPFPAPPFTTSRNQAPGLTAASPPQPPLPQPLPSHAMLYFNPAAVPLFPTPSMSHARSHARSHGSARAFRTTPNRSPADVRPRRADEVPTIRSFSPVLSSRYMSSRALSEDVAGGSVFGSDYAETVGSLSDSEWEDVVSDMDS